MVASNSFLADAIRALHAEVVSSLTKESIHA